MAKAWTMKIEVCSDCPHYEMDVTSRAYETTELDQKVWADAAYGRRAICLVLMQSMRQDDADKAVLSECPLDDATEEGS